MNSCPVDGLPSELLAVIFVTLNERSLYARSIGDRSYGAIDYPITLSSVCSRWRYIALNTPYLWSYIDFTTAGNALQNLAHVNRCFDRAQNSPLHIRFGTLGNGCLAKNLDDNIANLLLPSSPRLESLAISYYHVSFVEDTISTLYDNREAHPIERLALHAHSGSKRIIADPELLSARYLNQLFLNLESLYLDCVSPDWEEFPCRNLVELQLIELPSNGCPNICQLMNILKENTGLRSLKLSRFYLDPIPESAQPAEFELIPLPRLQNLDLNLNSTFIMSVLNIIAPGSDDVSLHVATWSAPDLTSVIDSLIYFSKRARVTSLHISRDGISFSQISRHFPHLRILRLSSQMLLEFTFAGLPELPELPHLHTFEIESCGNGSTQTGLRNMCRVPSLRQIRYTNFSLYDDGKRMSSEETVEWFKQECAGNDIRVEDSPELEFSTYPSPFI